LTVAAETGQVLDLATREHVDPADVASWSLHRQIPGALLRQVLTRRDLNVDSRGLVIQGARFTDSVDLQYVEFPHPLRLHGCSLEASLDMTGAKIRTLDLTGTHVGGLILDWSEIAGPMTAGCGFEAHGEIRALGATIKGTLDFGGAKLDERDGDALILDRAQITGGLFANSGFVAKGKISAVGATIRGTLDLRSAELSNVNGYALDLEDAEITGGVFGWDGFKAQGEIHAPRVTIKGGLYLDGAQLRNREGFGATLVLDNAVIAGGLFVFDGFTADGRISAKRARINGPLVLDDAKLWGDGKALDLEDAEITDGVFASRLAVQGEIHAPRVTIKGTLYLDGAEIRNLDPSGAVLVLDNAEIAGGVFAAHGFKAEGRISAKRATIRGSLDLSNAILRGADGTAVALDSAKVQRLILVPEEVDGSIDLSHAVFDEMETDERPPTVAGTGWVIGDIYGPLRVDWRAAQTWLNAQQNTTSVQPWYAMADVYERNGDPAAARRLRFRASKKVTAQSSQPTKLIRGVYSAVLGNGYYPMYAAAWLVLVLLVGWLIVGTNREYIVPARVKDATAAVASEAAKTGAKPDLWLPVTAETPCKAHPDYPCLNAFDFALNSLLVPAGGTTGSDWVVAPEASAVLTVGLPILKLASWALAALVLAVVTGLLRKT
jgi:uncharacterized protein YjbI with pentapeptide repeats